MNDWLKITGVIILISLGIYAISSKPHKYNQIDWCRDNGGFYFQNGLFAADDCKFPPNKVTSPPPNP